MGETTLFSLSRALMLLFFFAVPSIHAGSESSSLSPLSKQEASSNPSYNPSQTARAAVPPPSLHTRRQSLSSATIAIVNEADLTQAIKAATGPSLTTLSLPASLVLTKSLPDAVGPLKLINAGNIAVISCASGATAFTALSVYTHDFGMAGITWQGCSSVLKVSGTINVTIASCLFQQNLLTDPTMVRRFAMLCLVTDLSEHLFPHVVCPAGGLSQCGAQVYTCAVFSQCSTYSSIPS